MIRLLRTVLDGAGADRGGLLLGVTVNARVSGAGDVTATDATSAGQRALHTRKDTTTNENHRDVTGFRQLQ